MLPTKCLPTLPRIVPKASRQKVSTTLHVGQPQFYRDMYFPKSNKPEASNLAMELFFLLKHNSGHLSPLPDSSLDLRGENSQEEPQHLALLALERLNEIN